MTERRGNFMVLEGVGMGVTLIRRDAITLMLEKYPELIDERLSLHPAKDTMLQAGAKRMMRFFEKLDIPDRGLLSEDLSFCVRWNRARPGNKIWAAIGYRISHVGPNDFAGRYLDDIEKAAMDSALAAQQAPLPVTAQGVPELLGRTNGTGVGEPLKVVETSPVGIPPAKRGRGRPKKAEPASEAEQVKAAINAVAKEAVAVQAVNGPEKRKRGRPPKSYPQEQVGK